MSNPNESVVSWYGLVDSPLSSTSTTDFFQMQAALPPIRVPAT